MDNPANKIIEKIVEEKIPCIFISPHIDDAILSAGGLISFLSSKTDVKIINIFTKASPKPYTLYTRRFLSLCGYTDADKLFEDRKLEEKSVLNKIGVKHENLDFIDAAWRKGNRFGLFSKIFGSLVPEFGHLYPIHPMHINSEYAVKGDDSLKKEITIRLRSIIDKYPNVYIFCPLAIKSHVDHIVVRDVCTENFKKVILWSDFPYNQSGSIYKIPEKNLSNFVWKINKMNKIDLINEYKSQVYPLFKKESPNIIDERYYYDPKEFSRFNGSKPTVTVGIPAHNEAGSIATLMDSIISQNSKNFVFSEIVVVCDGCTDDTAKIVREYSQKNKLIKLIDDGKRLGQAERLNALYNANTSDIFITFDGDSFLGSLNTIDKMVEKFNDPNVGLVGGNYMPYKPETIFDKSMAVGHYLWWEIRKNYKNGYNMHNHLGCISALSKDFANVAKIPKGVIGNDCYIYALAIQNGYKFEYTHEAFVYIQLPRNLKDYTVQTSRFVDNSRSMEKFFGKWVINEIYIPTNIKVKEIVKIFFREPIYLPLSLFLRLTAFVWGKFIVNPYSKDGIWETVKSSKKIYE